MSQAQVLVVEDDPNLREALRETLALAGYDTVVAVNGEDALETLKKSHVGVVVSDVQMQPMDGIEMLKRIRRSNPELPAIMMTAYGNVSNAVTAMQLGAVDYLVKPFDADVLVEKVSRHLPVQKRHPEFIAEDPGTLRVLDLANRVALSNATVMITGSSGVGKEVFAQHIHRQSKRRDGPFVAINCAAIPTDMLEATLFGYKKGAFTGACSSQVGKFEQAQNGTLLLDEVSEMDLGLQAKLLRVLQERELERLGERTTIKLDVRVLATTNRDLLKAVRGRQFREDLYYRLNVFPLNVPDLRDRPADIIPLANHFLRNSFDTGKVTPTLTKNAQQALLSHDWSGNVRELENLIQRSAILSVTDKIDVVDFDIEPGETPATTPSKDLESTVKRHERQRILEALTANLGNRQHTADQLGISPRTLRYKLARFRDEGISIPGESVAKISSGVAS